MLSRFNPANVLRNIKEFDIRPIRDAAEKPVRLVIAGTEAERLQALANQLRRDPRRPDDIAHTLVPLVDLAAGSPETPGGRITADAADLVLLVLTREPEHRAAQAEALQRWSAAGIPVITILDPDGGGGELLNAPAAGGVTAIFADIDDWGSLQIELAPAMLRALPDEVLALSRSFPLLRETAARKLITDVSSDNAAYSFSTGLAEIIPGLGIPLNVADMIVLTKAQALLVYKLGLALGLRSDWQYYMTEFSSVVGSGFAWRQVARSLVGLIPAWGIIPKVAVAYSGTYAVGQAVLYWYLTGKHATRKMLRGFMREALARGKAIGQNLRKRLPRRKRDALPAGEQESVPEAAEASPKSRICTHCGTVNESDARFCKQCGQEI